MGKTYPPFSVLMAVYAKDNPAWIAQALDSVLHNTVPPAEIVVVQDGPVPPEISRVLAGYRAKYPRIKPVVLEQNRGLGIALQKGLEACSCELVARMDADDISLPERFEKQLACFVQTPDLAVLGGTIEEVDAETLHLIAIRRVPQTDEQCRKFLKTRSPFNHVSVMFKKNLILQVGNYQPFHLMEDYYLWARCAAQHFKMGNMSSILVRVRVNAAMYGRRGGWEYFKSNVALSAALRRLGLISWPVYLFNLAVRFTVQVAMPNFLRSLFYKKILRYNHD